MQTSTPSGSTIYNLTAGKTLPEWISEAKKKALKKNAEFRSRLELIQDLYFPSSCQRIKYSPNGEWLVATGIYPPSVKVYYLNDLAMSYERRVDAPVVQFQILSEDTTKMAFLRNDRNIELHAAFGKYYTIRVPKPCRDMIYDYNSCDLLTLGSSSSIFRLNLEKGTFLKPLVSSLSGINVGGIDPQHGLYMFGGEEGLVEFWDPRVRKPIGYIDSAAHVQKLTEGFISERCEVTSVRFRPNGLGAGIGTSTGQVLLYDLRLSEPLIMRDHNFGVPITDIKFQEPSGFAITSCQKIIKIWNPNTNELFGSIEVPNMENIEDICIRDNTGLIFAAGEHKKINIFYIPDIGLAPYWCRFVDNFTEELEEKEKKSGTIYTDYKFMTREELESLGFEKLIGTEYVRAYMHGFFIDVRLYNRIRSIANPNEYQEWKREKIQKKMEEKRQSRIHIVKDLPKINRDLAQHLSQTKKKSENAKEDLLKGRFSKLFSDPNFIRDPDADPWKNNREKLLKVEEIENEPEVNENYSEVEDEKSDDEKSTSSEEQNPTVISESDKQVEELRSLTEKPEKKKKPQADPWSRVGKRKIKHFEAKSDNLAPFRNESVTNSKKLEIAPLHKRLEIENTKNPDKAPPQAGFGSLSFTYTSEKEKLKAAKIAEQRKQQKERNKDRRGMKEVDPKLFGEKKRRKFSK